MSEKEVPLLLHICCGPCATGCLPRLTDREVVLYYSNSNLCSPEEYEKRLDSAYRVAKAFGRELLTDPYDHESWLAHVTAAHGDPAQYREKGLRCGACFAWSLSRTAEKAAELGMHFATTLTVSPHKNSRLIFSIGGAYAHFEPWDFKKENGFALSIAESKRLELYRQNFCGCEFSRMERGL